MTKFDVVRHDPLSQILEVLQIRFRLERTVGLALDDKNAKAHSPLNQMEVPTFEKCHLFSPSYLVNAIRLLAVARQQIHLFEHLAELGEDRYLPTLAI